MSGCYIINMKVTSGFDIQYRTFVENTPEEAVKTIEYLTFKYLTKEERYIDNPNSDIHMEWRKELWTAYLKNSEFFHFKTRFLDFIVKYCEPTKIPRDFALPPLDVQQLVDNLERSEAE